MTEREQVNKDLSAGGMMYQRLSSDEYVSPLTCELHHQLVEGKIEIVTVRVKALEDKVGDMEKRVDVRLNALDAKIDKLLDLQTKLQSYLLYIAIGVVLTLIGVITGRAVDLGWILH